MGYYEEAVQEYERGNPTHEGGLDRKHPLNKRIFRYGDVIKDFERRVTKPFDELTRVYLRSTELTPCHRRTVIKELAKAFELYEYSYYSEEREPYSISGIRDRSTKVGRLIRSVHLLLWNRTGVCKLNGRLSGLATKETCPKAEDFPAAGKKNSRKRAIEERRRILHADIYSILSNMLGRTAEETMLINATTFLIDTMTDQPNEPIFRKCQNKNLPATTFNQRERAFSQ
jgi:hypothetical protein